MPIKTVCKCGAKFTARSALAGKTIECTACGRGVRVPVPEVATAGGVGTGAVLGISAASVAAVGAAVMVFFVHTNVTQVRGELDKTRAEAKLRTEGLQKDLADVDKRLVSVDSSLAKATGEITDRAAKADAKAAVERKRLDQVRKEVAQARKDRKQLDGLVTNLRIKEVAIQGELRKNATAIKTVKKQVADGDADARRLLADLESKAKMLRKDLADTAKERRGLDSKIAQTQRTVDVKLAALRTSTQAQKLTLAALETRLEDEFQTVRSSVNGAEIVTRMTTDTGQTLVLDTGGAILGSFPPAPLRGGSLQRGRFHVEAVPDPAAGDLYVFRLDSFDGRLWRARITPPPGGFTTTPATLWTEYRSSRPQLASMGDPARRWRVDVDEASAINGAPGLALTGPDGGLHVSAGPALSNVMGGLVSLFPNPKSASSLTPDYLIRIN